MTKKSFLSGALALTLAGAVCKVLGAIYRIPLGNAIGTEGMGNYQMAYPVFSLLVVISTSGIPTAISRLVSERIAEGKAGAAGHILRVSLMALGIIGGVSMVLMALLSAPLSRLLGMETAQWSMVAIAPSLLFVAIVSAMRGYFQGMRNMTPTSISQIIEQCVKLLAGLWLARQWAPYGPEYGAAGALLGVSISELAGLGVMALFLCFARRGQPKPLGDTRGALREIFTIALPITIGACVVPLVSAIDSAMVMRVLTGMGYEHTAASSLFGLLTGFVLPLINMPGVVSVAVGISLVPYLSSARAQGREEAVSRLSSLAMRLAVLIGMPSGIGFFALADPILRLLYPSLAGSSLLRATQLLEIMSGGVLLLSLVQVCTGILQGLGRQNWAVLSLLLGAVCKVGLGIWLMQVPALNVAGAAMGTLICFGVAAVLDCAMVVRICSIEFSAAKFLFKPLLAAAALGFTAKSLYGVLAASLGNGLAVLLAILAGAAVYSGLLLWLGAVGRQDLRVLKAR